MNRVEFMETLSRLLQDIPEEDRIDALKYYNDYFDDAGSENEQNVIEELESPEKVAMKIKADREDTEDGKEGGTEKTTEEAIGKVTREKMQHTLEPGNSMTGKTHTSIIRKIHTEKKRIIRYIRITEPMIMKARRKSRGQTNG